MPNQDGNGPLWARLNKPSAQENALDLKNLNQGQGMGRGRIV